MMNRIIRNKILKNMICDSEIIREMKSAKEIPGFDINLECNEDNWSLLMNIVYWNRKELVEYLILTYPNINVNHRTYHGYTALYFCDQVSILKLLLNRKDLDVNIQNVWGQTGLHRFCVVEHKTCVKELLLDARVNKTIRDNDGKTAQYYALKYGYSDIAKILNNSGYTSLLRILNRTLIHDIVRMIIEEYA